MYKAVIDVKENVIGEGSLKKLENVEKEYEHF